MNYAQAGIILCVPPANGRRSYIVNSSFIALGAYTNCSLHTTPFWIVFIYQHLLEWPSDLLPFILQGYFIGTPGELYVAFMKLWRKKVK